VLGIPALGITDRNTLAGMVRAHQRAQEAGVRLVPGCRLDLTDGASVLVYPTDRTGWRHLCQLLTLGKARGGKGACTLGWEDFAAYAQGLLGILCAGIDADRLHRLHAIMADRAYVALTPYHQGDDAVHLARIAHLARAARVATVATNDVLYHAPGRRILQDVLTCIREGSTIDTLGYRRERSVTRHLQAPAEMARLLARHPDALDRTQEIVDRCAFSLDQLRYQYPHETQGDGLTAQQTLERLTWEGAARRYDGAVPDAVTRQLRHELTLIGQLGHAPYFLTVDSIVRFARSRGILCQGRGSAANSAVCYVLGITAIDPTRSGLLFERFISAERKEPPDIDVDFEHERREEVIQWIYDTYGRDRAALCATVIRYRGRGAVRDVGKALGLTEDITAALASQISHWGEEEITEEHIAELNLSPSDRRLRLTIELTRALTGFPRHLSQHPGGFVLTQDRLDALVPIEPAAMADRQVIEWDKDDIDALRFMKVDVLGLGMLGCMRRAFDLLAAHRGARMTLSDVPAEDPDTYAMIRKADTLGTFQIESRAQMSMLPRLKPRTFYDLVIQVAIVRPGPIQGDMVHPYLRRREGLEPVDYPTPELRRVLEKTLGVPLFQEQAMQVAIVCAGFTPGEADALRRSMATFKFTGGVHHFRDKMISGMVERGYTAEFAAETFSRIEGFGSYGFPESHAASFAIIAYASSWMKCHHPDIFCAALLNAQPMGFYAPAQIVRDTREHGVTVRPVCVNASAWDCTLEPADGRFLAVRLGFRMVKGMGRPQAERLRARRDPPFHSVDDVWRRTVLPVASLQRLAQADAFQGLGLDRRQALWAIRALSDDRLPLLDFARVEAGRTRDLVAEPPAALRRLRQGAEVVEDYRSVGLSLRRHPVAFLRRDLDRRGIVRCADLATRSDGSRLTTAGIVLVRQRPGSARGVLFMTIEDETGHANLIVWSSLFEAERRRILAASMLACRGRLQRESGVIHVVAESFIDLSDLLRDVAARDDAGAVHDVAGEYRPRADGGSDGHQERGLGGREARNIHVHGRRPAYGIRVPTRDFR
jgi:error-prone DNA polymerase